MTRTQLKQALFQTLHGRRLLDHPFYQRWSAGTVTHAELRSYAAQYAHFERMLPAHLQGIADAATTDELRRQALINLADEAGGEVTHMALFERFAAALGAEAEAPSPAMQRMLDTYAAALRAGSAEGFAALWAYEAQASEVTASKSVGLRAHYGMTTEDTIFWDVHAEVDTGHAEWAVDALATASTPEATLTQWAKAAADAWWDFLSEREALPQAA